AAADVADDVHVRDVVEGGGGVSDRLHNRYVRSQDVLEEVLAVAGDRQRADAHEPGGADLPEQLLGVLDGVSLRQGITTEEELPIGREDDRLGGGAAEIAAENGERRARRVSSGR